MIGWPLIVSRGSGNFLPKSQPIPSPYIYIYIYVYLISLGSLRINFTIFTSFFSVIAQLLSPIGVVVLHHNFQVNILISHQSWFSPHQFHDIHFFLLCYCSVALFDCHRCSTSRFPGKHSPLPIFEIITLIWAFAY